MSKEIVLEVRDDILEKILFSHVFLLLSSLWCLSLSYYSHCWLQAHGIVLQMLYIIFLITYFLMPIILKYVDI